MKEINIGFVGAGNIAKAHAFAITSLPYYYEKLPLNLLAVTSIREESRSNFAKEFDFVKALSKKDFWNYSKINTVFISSPNMYHYEDLTQAVKMPNVERIYIEKPLCVDEEEIQQLQALLTKHKNKQIQVGFQFLQMASIRKALALWQAGNFGIPLHFRAKYLHSGYLSSAYRSNKIDRLKPAPIGGAIADLGSHVFSLLNVFLGDRLSIIAATQGGSFADVPCNSELYAEVLLKDDQSKAVGSLVASRISKGAQDHLEIEIRGNKGAFIVSTIHPDILRICLDDNNWTEIFCGNDYKPISAFPNGAVSAGWLRSLIHAVYLFLTQKEPTSFIPDLNHGIKVQCLLNEVTKKLHAN